MVRWRESINPCGCHAERAWVGRCVSASRSVKGRHFFVIFNSNPTSYFVFRIISMKKQYCLFLIPLFLFQLTFSNSFLHRSHRTILDSTEQPVRLKGVNLGGWLLWEEWIWGGGFHSQTHIMDALTQMSSREDAERFRDSVCFNYISESDIRKIHDAHMNVVRVTLNWRFFSSTGPDPVYPIGWRVFDSLLARCKRHGVYAILDMHAAPGGNSPYFIA